MVCCPSRRSAVGSQEVADAGWFGQDERGMNRGLEDIFHGPQ
jgi:hypothetical protein